MQSIIKELYCGNIDELEKDFDKSCSADDKEGKLFDKLKEMINKEQFGIFCEFIELYTTRFDNIIERKYVRGFKTGLLIGMECANFKL